MQLKVSTLFACVGALTFSAVTIAAPTSSQANFIVFGNSLSDTGNTHALTHQPAYWNGRFSNSYVWNEYTSKLLGMKLENHAYGGATTNNAFSPTNWGNISIPSFHDQVTAWLKNHPKPDQFHLANDVIEIEIGGNDILHALKALVSGSGNGPSIAKLPSLIAQSIAHDTKRLFDAGYKKIYLWNLPAVGKTPVANSFDASALVKPIVNGINQAVAKAVEPQGVHVLDLFSLMSTALEPQVLKALHITDSTDACYVAESDGKAKICPDPNAHFFYDGIHPASRMHYLWGVAAALLTENPDIKFTTDEVLKLIKDFNIGSSNREHNLIVDGETPVESSDVPHPEVSTTSDGGSYETSATVTYVEPPYPTFTDPVPPPKCH